MNKTGIEWCDMTWNPVTGCKHGCEYCYARRIAARFSYHHGEDGGEHFLGEPIVYSPLGKDERVDPFPYGFDPTFHRYRFDDPQKVKKPQNIFVCSMADLFGRWVPTRWIRDVLDACLLSPQHRYLFLTKNPARYLELDKVALLPHRENFWYGSTVPDMNATAAYRLPGAEASINTFWSMEPLLGPVDLSAGEGLPRWIILGAMTGPGSRERQPKREWVDDIVRQAEKAGIPVFMKDSLIPVVGKDNMRREFPWEGGMIREHSNGQVV